MKVKHTDKHSFSIKGEGKDTMKRMKNLGAIIMAAALFCAACETPINNNNNNNNNDEQEQEQEQQQEHEQLQEYTITVNSDVTGGLIIPVPEKAKEGDTVTLVAAPAVFYKLAGAPLVSADNTMVDLSGNGQSEPYSFIMPAANVTVLPSFVIHSSHNTLPVYNDDDLALIGNNDAYPLNGVYQLQNDITLPENWAPIGDGKKVFSGIFDGNGKTITANTFLYEDDNGPLEYPGVFGFTVAATIKNLTLNLNQVKAQPQSAYFGFLAAYSLYSELQDIALTGDFEINLDNTIQYSVGAIAGVLDHSQLQRSRHQGNLTVSRKNEENPNSIFVNNIGGLAGLTTNSSIRECAVTGDVSIASLFMYAGGISGKVEKSVMTVNTMIGNLSCRSFNDYYGNSVAGGFIRIGGLAGYFDNGSITEGVFDGDLLVDLNGTTNGRNTAVAQVGGVIGYFYQNASASRLSVEGHIEFNIAGLIAARSSTSIGGIAGYSDDNIQIQNSCFEGDINVADGLEKSANADYYISAGGIIGFGQKSTIIKACYASGAITATNEDAFGTTIGKIAKTYTGGIAGYLTNGSNEINSCYYTGNVTSKGVHSHAGGIVGFFHAGTSNETKIIQCYALLGNVLAKGSGTKGAENTLNSMYRIAAGGIVGKTHISSSLPENNYRLAVEYCAALYDSSCTIKAEGTADNIFAGTIAGNRNTQSSNTSPHPGGILTANITNIPTSAIDPYDGDTSDGATPSARKNGEYVANITQESFFTSTEEDPPGLGWDTSVWAWDSVKGLPKLAWQ